MGAGASNPEAEQHLRKWDNAVNDLQQLCNDQRRSMGLPVREPQQHRPEAPSSRSGQKDRTPPAGQDDGKSEKGTDQQHGFRRRTSSLVSFDPAKNNGPISPGAAESENRGRVRPTLDEEHVNGGAGPMSPGKERVRPEGANFSPQAREGVSPSAPHRNVTREQVTAIKKTRMDVYKSYHTTDQLEEIEGQHACSHFAVVAAGLSAIMGGQFSETDRKKKVTVEDLFFAAQIPLQALHNDQAIMTEIFDVVREFVDVDNRFKDAYTVECVHMDIAPVVGTVEAEGNEVGDRQTRVAQPDLRKQIQQDIEEDADSVRFVFYDPFIVHRAMTQDDDSEEDDDGDGLLVSVSSKPKGAIGKSRVHAKPGTGALAAIGDFRNAVQPMVTLVHATCTDRLHTHTEELPLQHVYKAMHAVMTPGRAGGFIRVTKKKSDTSTDGGSQSAVVGKDEVDSFFSAELCSGKVNGSKREGTDAHVTNDRISRHIGALGWAFHFLGGADPNTHNHGHGLPISKIIRELKLPIDVFERCDLTLDQVFGYLSQYLIVSGKDQSISAQLCPVLTKNHRPDAPPSLSVFEFEAALLSIKGVNEDPENPSSIIVLQYNPNIAHNVIDISRKSQWCVLIGYDEDLQMAKVIDANALRFSASWTVSLESLHKAITNYGYITLKRKGGKSSNRGSLAGSTSSRDRTGIAADRSPDAGSLRHVNSTVQAHFDRLQQQQTNFPITDVIEHFVYPSDVLSITQIPVALRRLGAKNVTVENVVHWLPFDINSLMGATLSLHTMSLLFTTFSELYNTKTQEEVAKAGGPAEPEFAIDVEVKHADRVNSTEKSMLLTDFGSVLQEWSANQASQVVLVNFSAEHLDVFGTCNPCGEYGIVVGYDKTNQIVSVADVNRNRFFRTWKVGMVELYNAMYHPSASFRSRGLLILHKVEKLFKSSGDEKSGILSRPCDLSVVPLQNGFAVSPSPQIQALSFAFAQLGYSFSPEEIFYEAYLKTLTDQRRRGSQAFAWRDVEVTLNTLNKVTTEICAKVGKRFLESRKVHTLATECVDDTEEEDFLAILSAEDAFGPKADCVYLANYNTEIVHGVQGMGNSMCLIESYDPKTKTLGLFEAEHVQFGLRWKTDIDIFIQACDLEAEGKSDYGLVKVFTKDGASPNQPKVGAGFSAFGGNGEGSGTGNSPTQNQSSPTGGGGGRRTRGAVFVEGSS